jgi:hypothetical protein
MSGWHCLFSDETLAKTVECRAALAEAAMGEGAERLIARLSLNIPVFTGMREIKRWITEPFVDRFNDNVPGGDIGIRVAYDFTGDASLLTVKPETFDLTQKFMGTVVGNSVELSHMQAGQGADVILGNAAREGERFADILNHLRNEAIPYNAELVGRIRAVCL